MLKRFALLLSLTAGFTVSGYAQKTCSTDDVYQKLKLEHPEIAVYEAQLENEIKNGVSNGSLSQFAKTTNGPDTTNYDIPIVIHIIHDYGTVDFISDNDIHTAVDYWTTVDLGQNYSDSNIVIQPFKKYIGNPHIHLHLATIDPDGNPTKGILRHQSYLTANGGDEAKMDDWPQNKYVNIWFVNTFGAANAGAAAYAYYPSNAQSIPYYDGVICLSSYINEDKTIPHELGHVFNLEHVWGNNNNAAVTCGDDMVDDTPPTKGHLFDCGTIAGLYDTTCATGYAKTYKYTGTNTDSVTVDYPDTANAQNIMDYSGCMEMFTIGQVARMRKALASATAGRNNLWSAQNLAATGALAPYPDLPPTAEFSVEKGQSNVGVTVERSFFLCANNATNFIFRNRSWNDTVTSVQWTFSNGASTPTSTSIFTVSTKFSQPGWATVSLNATSNAGTGTTSRMAVYVADTVALHPALYTQEFATQADLDNWPMFNYYNNNFKWESYTGAGYDDNSCIRYRSYDYRTSPENKSGTPVGDYDDVFTPGFDLTGASGTVNLNFYTAGSKLSGNVSVLDTMDIWASITCGTSWVKIATLQGASLSNNTAKSTEYVPASAAEWKAQTIAIPTTYQSSKTFFKFRYRPGSGGNNLYMDKFSISGVPTEVREVMNNPNLLNIYPNPAHNGCNMTFMTGEDGNVTFEIRDVTGKLVYQKAATYATRTAIQEFLPANAIPSAGMYFVTVSNSGKRMTQKLITY